MADGEQPLLPAGLTGAVWAQTQPPSPASSPEMQKFAVWYGDWTSVGECHATPLGPAGELEGRELCWFDPAAKKFAYVFLGSDGYFEQGSFTMTGELCAWECTGVAAGTTFRSRGTEVVSSDKRILTRKAEISFEGKTWRPFFDSKFTKVGTK